MLRKWQRGGGGGDWELSLPGLLDYWKVGRRETIVSGDLQQWDGIVTGAPMTAVSVGQRPTAGAGGGWQWTPANLTELEDNASAIASLVQGAVTYSVVSCLQSNGNGSWLGFGLAGNSTVMHDFAETGNPAQMRIRRATVGAANSNYVVSPAFNAAPLVKVMGMQWVSGVARFFLEGAEVLPSLVNVDSPPSLDRMNMGARADSTPSNFADMELFEHAIYLGALTDEQFAFAAAKMAAEYR